MRPTGAHARTRPGVRGGSRAVIALLLMLLLTAWFVQPAQADSTLRVFYAGPDGSVKTALQLAGYALVQDASQADVFVLNGEIPTDAALRARRAEGAGLVLILGPGMTEAQVTELLGVPVVLRHRADAVSLTTLHVDDSLVSSIAWNGAPQVHERYEVVTPVSSVQPLVTAYEDGGWVLWQARPRVLVLDAFLDGANPQLQEWSYFNY